MTRARRRAAWGSSVVLLLFVLGVAAAYAGLLGMSAKDFAWQTGSELIAVADRWYAWIDKFGKLGGFFVTVGSGAYAIYHKYHFAEFNMHVRLKEFLAREEERLKEANTRIVRALRRPSPARDFEAPIFSDETLNPVLREMKWGKRSKAEGSLQKTLSEIEEQLTLWGTQKSNYEQRKQQALLLKGAIAAARAAKGGGEQARSDNLEALNFFQEAYAISNDTDADALEYVGHQQVRLGDFPLALQTFEALAAKYADGPSLPRARALKFQAEINECKTQPNLARANGLLIQAVNALPTNSRLLEKAEIHELHGRVREKARISLATQSYTQAELNYQRIVDGRNDDGDDIVAAKAGLRRVRDALQRIRLAPLNGEDNQPAFSAPADDASAS
jgi:tetratricopeptide (TPR) repeat protein